MVEEVYSYENMCAVSLKLHDGTDEIEGNASGILIDARQCLVLTHASLLYPMVERIPPAKLSHLRNKGFIDHSFLKGQTKVQVVLPNMGISQTRDSLNKDKQIQISLLNSSVQERAKFSTYNGKLKGMFECRNLRRTIQRLTPKESWQFVDDPVVNANEKKALKKVPENEELYAFLLPCFILIKLLNISDFEKKALNDNFSIRSGTENRQGDLVEICSTPFGLLSPQVFLNSVSQGIISNIAGPRGVLIMTDARCVPGCEGGGLFYCDGYSRSLTGVMIASLCWKNNEWVGLSMACSISEIMDSLTQLSLPEPKECVHVLSSGSSFREQMMKKMQHHITYVSVGHSWGTGILIQPDIIITCSHVLKGSHRDKVLTNRQIDEGVDCDIVYQTPSNSQFDLAIIRLTKLFTDTSGVTSINFGPAQEGEVVYVIGHAIFKPDLDLLPMVTRGIVSKVIRYNNIPVMIQTTCAVHAGVSGGGVFNIKGQLVAIVVCNSRDTVTGACYPHVNMCIPMATIAPVINKYLETKDPSVLNDLQLKNKYIERLWNIGTQNDVSPHCTSRL